MYGPKWPFLLMYTSHEPQIFRKLTGGQRDTPRSGRHNIGLKSRKWEQIQKIKT